MSLVTGPKKTEKTFQSMVEQTEKTMYFIEFEVVMKTLEVLGFHHLLIGWELRVSPYFSFVGVGNIIQKKVSSHRLLGEMSFIIDFLSVTVTAFQRPSPVG